MLLEIHRAAGTIEFWDQLGQTENTGLGGAIGLVKMEQLGITGPTEWKQGAPGPARATGRLQVLQVATGVLQRVMVPSDRRVLKMVIQAHRGEPGPQGETGAMIVKLEKYDGHPEPGTPADVSLR